MISLFMSCATGTEVAEWKVKEFWVKELTFEVGIMCFVDMKTLCMCLHKGFESEQEQENKWLHNSS